MNQPPVMLAGIESCLFTLGVMAVLAIFGWIKNKMSGEGATSSSPSRGANDDRLRELAAQRKAQLEEMAARRRGQASGTPSNITMPEQAARNQARAEYEARSQAMRQQGGASTPEARRQRMQELAQRAKQNQQQQARAGARPAQPRQPQQPQQRQAPQAPASSRALNTLAQGDRRMPSQMSAEEREAAARREAEAQQKRRRRAKKQEEEAVLELVPEDEHPAHVDGVSAAHRLVRDADSKAYGTRAKRISRIAEFQTREGWRDAFILKELLDKPLALREQQKDPWD